MRIFRGAPTDRDILYEAKRRGIDVHLGEHHYVLQRLDGKTQMVPVQNRKRPIQDKALVGAIVRFLEGGD